MKWHLWYYRLLPSCFPLTRLLVRVLTENIADRFADPSAVARSFYDHAYSIGRKNLPEGQSVLTFIRTQMDQLGIGKDLQEFPWGGRLRKLPPSKMFAQTE